jgi:hypothetical protein
MLLNYEDVRIKKRNDKNNAYRSLNQKVTKPIDSACKGTKTNAGFYQAIV